MSQSDNPLVRKLMHFAPLTPADVEILDRLSGVSESFEPHTDIVAEGQMPRSVFVVQKGIACRYRLMADGRRQIMTFLIPGDFCDLHAFLLREMDHSIGALSPLKVVSVTRDQLMDIAFHHPRVSAAFWWSSLQEEAILRERIVALGRRNARGRIAYLLCELVWRHQAIGLTNGDSMKLPFTQNELADTLGLTAIHVNRVLQELRRMHLITLDRRDLVLLNTDRLQEIAEFNPGYLNFGGAPAGVEAYFERLENESKRARMHP